MRLALAILACAACAAPSPAPTPAPAPARTPAPAPAPAPTLTWSVSHKVEPDSRGCPVLRLTVARGADLLAHTALRDECQDDPAYACDENGAGCATRTFEHLGWLDLGGQRFAWVKEHAEWHDNGSVDVHLYGYACDKLAPVWGYSWIRPGEASSATVTARGDGVETLSATVTSAGASAETEALVWDPERCRYRRAG